MSSKKQNDSVRGEVLVALLKDVSDFAILRDQGWYRIPEGSAPKNWPPKWLAFYQPKSFAPESYRVQYYGEVKEIETVPRHDLFPNEFENSKSNQLYYRLSLKKLEALPRPILSLRPRRLVFISTTYDKLMLADQINDLYDESPLEDMMWKALKLEQIGAERQWWLKMEKNNYMLDFALFCKKGFINIETDGDYWHTREQKRIDEDNVRNNTLASIGWKVLRFNGLQIRQHIKACIEAIMKTINTLKGLSDDGLVSRVFYKSGGQIIQQLGLFENKGSYSLDSGAQTNLDI